MKIGVLESARVASNMSKLCLAKAGAKGTLVCLAVALSIAWVLTPKARASAPEQVKVLSLNVFLDSQDGLDKMAEVIRHSQADIVGLQESSSQTEALAKLLGFQWIQQGEDTAILTRFEVVGSTPEKWGVELKLPGPRKLTVFNVHLYHVPYQPYQLLGIPYGDFPFLSTARQAIESARQARGHEVERVISELRQVQGPVVMTGDFNEPSHLDWTEGAVRARRHPLKVEWPTSLALAGEGLQDSFRTLYPDEVMYPGFTWNTRTRPTEPKDHHDRIDFVLFRGRQLRPIASEVISEKVIPAYPSDHRGVLTTFDWEG